MEPGCGASTVSDSRAFASQAFWRSRTPAFLESVVSDRRIPSVSVIIPTYNRARTIGSAIQSVLAQSFQDFEIIVVDDHSADPTRTIVEGFRDPRIRYLSREQNRGPAAARNAGIRAALGTYLAFLDSDDQWLPHKLSEQIALLEGLSPEWGMSCSGFFLLVNGCGSIRLPSRITSWHRRLHWICDLSPGTTLVVRRECLTRVGLFDEEFPRLEDWDLLLRLSKVYKLALVRKPLARVHRGPLPAADLVEISTRRLLEKHGDELRATGWFYRREIASRHWLGLAYWFYREGRLSRGNLFLLKAFVENPLGTSAVSWVLWALRNKLPSRESGVD